MAENEGASSVINSNIGTMVAERPGPDTKTEFKLPADMVVKQEGKTFLPPLSTEQAANMDALAKSGKLAENQSKRTKILNWLKSKFSR